MFDVGWSEMAIIAVVILVVLGPKELPHALKTMSHWLRAARKLGSEFQSGVNEIVRDAELEDARKQLQGLTKNTIEQKIAKTVDPGGDIKKTMTEAANAAKIETSSSTAPNLSPPVVTPSAPVDRPPLMEPPLDPPAEVAATSQPVSDTATSAPAGEQSVSA